MTQWALDPTVVHLNHGSFGAVTRETQALVAAARRRVDRNPMRFFARQVLDEIDRATRVATEFLGAPPGTVGLVTNATEATHAVLRSIDWRPGDTIVTTDHGYPAVDRQLEDVRRRHAVVHRVVEVPLGVDDGRVVDIIGAAAEGARLVVVDAITSATAWRLPVERLVPAIRSAGALVLVDGAHAPGHVPVDITALAPDFWVGNFHKWACSPPAVAALHVHERHTAHMRPPVPSSSDDRTFPDHVRWRGTRDLAPVLVLPGVLEAAARYTSVEVRSRNDAVGRRLADAVAAVLGAATVPLPTCNMKLVPVPQLRGRPSSTRTLQAAIADELGVEVAVTNLGGDLFLRLSVHLHVGDDCGERLVAGVRRIVEHVARTT